MAQPYNLPTANFMPMPSAQQQFVQMEELKPAGFEAVQLVDKRDTKPADENTDDKKIEKDDKADEENEKMKKP